MRFPLLGVLFLWTDILDNRQPFKSRVGPSGFCALTVLVVQGGAALATLSVLLGLAGRTDSLRAQFGLLVGQASSAFWTTAGLVLLGVALGVVLALGGLFLRKRLVRSARASKNHRRQEELAQVYLDVASVALVALDSQGRITMLNRKGHEILGYHEGELIGQSWFNTCVPEGIRKNVRAVFERFMAGELPLAEFFENDVMTRSGKLRRIAWHNVTLTDNRGRIVGTLSSGQDVTAQKQFEKEREELIKKLESQNTELERFTYMVSHDLKSPLITVKGYLGLASEDLREGDTDAVADSLHRMTKAADRMEALLAELLELSRIGRLAEPSEDVSLEELAHEAVEIVAGRLNQRGV
ncbi:MAG: PAS domain S-box protein, partial [Pirellulales bacterium]|nr:PAS domain S-box protein [Pirellulales bacterium]